MIYFIYVSFYNSPTANILILMYFESDGKHEEFIFTIGIEQKTECIQNIEFPTINIFQFYYDFFLFSVLWSFEENTTITIFHNMYQTRVSFFIQNF